MSILMLVMASLRQFFCVFLTFDFYILTCCIAKCFLTFVTHMLLNIKSFFCKNFHFGKSDYFPKALLKFVNDLLVACGLVVEPHWFCTTTKKMFFQN